MLRDWKWEAAAFYSCQTRGAEQRYSTTELEALALVSTIEHFAYYLYGREFMAYTDHKLLCQLLTSDRLNPTLRRLSLKLQHWLVKVEYLPGKENGMADALSREERPRMVSNYPKTPDASRMWRYQPPHEAPAWEALQRGVPTQEERDFHKQ